MKKLFTLLVLISLVIGANGQAKNVGFFGFEKALEDQNDALLNILRSDPVNFTVDFQNLSTVDNTVVLDLSIYDIIIVQESFQSGAGILKPGTTPVGALAIPNLNKPTLYNKAYAMRASGALGTGAVGTAAENWGSLCLKVAVANQSNALFNGCTFTGDSLQCFNGFTDDNGAPAGTKAINYTWGDDAVTSATLLGTPNKTSAEANVMICLNDIPSGTLIGTTQTTAARMVTIGFNYGAMINLADATTHNMNVNGGTLLRNIMLSLAGATIPTTPIDPSIMLPTSVKTAQANRALIITRGNQFELQYAKSVKSAYKVYNIGGKVVKEGNINGTSVNIDLNGMAKGLYIIRANQETRKVLVK